MNAQPFNAWSVATTGFKYLPHSLVVQAAAVTGAVAMGQVAWDTVKEAFFPSDSKMCDAVKNASLLQKAAMFGPVFQMTAFGAGEELMIRGILQDGLLTRVPKAVLGIFGRNHWVDSRPAQVVRVGISGALFAAAHLANSLILSPGMLRFQLANTLGLGIAAAALKERTGSVLAAAGLHGLYNFLAGLIPTLWVTTNACSISKSDPTPMSFASSPSSRSAANRPAPDQSVSLDQNTCPMESTFTYPACSSKNSSLAKKAKDSQKIAEYLKGMYEDTREEAESLLQLAQSPYPAEVPANEEQIFVADDD